MAGRLGILACGGELPVAIAEAHPDAVPLALAGVPHDLGARAEEHRLEHLGELFAAFKACDVTRVVLAGALSRPALDPAEFDDTMREVAPGLVAAMREGDDALLRQVIALFEENGLPVVGAYELLPDLTAREGHLAGPDPGTEDLGDAARAAEILLALSAVDVGQGCAVAGGQCLGIETLQGTDATLRFVGATAPELRRGFRGVYVKAAKRGQDLRVDMPTIGPKTIAAVTRAGLAGLVIETGRVMILDRERTLQAAEESGIFLISQGL